jgi:predicted transcriptional regulator
MKIDDEMFRKIESELEILERHLKILRIVIENEPIGILKISEETGLSNHKVRYSLRILEHFGLIEPSPHGAVLTKRATEIIARFDEDLSDITERFERVEKIAREIVNLFKKSH